MNKFNSALIMQKLVFDKILFERKGFKSDKELSFEFQVQIGRSEDGDYKVTLGIKGDKAGEYSFEVSLSGFFEIDNTEALEDKRMQDLINKNAIAILMPYLRSEVTLLTAQPDTDSVVLPPFNINKMMDDKN